MSTRGLEGSLEEQIGQWRSYVRHRRGIHETDVAELEDHLRELIADLTEAGLAADEAFLVAVKRLGALDALSREFAREHSERLWKQLVLSGGGVPGAAGPAGADEASSGARAMWVALGLALAAAVAIRLPALFGVPVDPDASLFYPVNITFFTLPFIAAYFAWARPVPVSTRAWVAAAFVLAAIVVNAYWSGRPAETSADTLTLSILHLPIALWLAVGVAYVGGSWRGSERRMDFIRFTGELFIYFVLIAMGGGVLIALTFALFQAIGVDVAPLVQNWIAPCGFAGATVVAAWLVEAKKSVIENMAPVLARVFIPLFAVVLLAFVLTMAVTGRAIDVQREILIAVDLLLVVVFGLLLYSISARDPVEPPRAFDWIQLTLVGTALLVDVLALWAIGTRISEMGWTPNRFAALGMNVVLLVNLAGSAVLYLRFLRGGGRFMRLWSWQMSYVYVIAGWAAIVAFLFPPLFGFD